MRTTLAIVGLAMGLSLSAPALAQTPAGPGTEAKLTGAQLYQQRTCIACHGPDAKTAILPVYPKLAGQNPDYLLQQMHDIKSGARSNGNTPAMRGVMHLVSDEEMKAIADWLGGLTW